MSRVALESLGCKLNQAEMEALADRLVSRGHVLTDSAEEADVYVLNTCSVTHIADRKSRQALRAARRANPQARVIATGCYARRAPGELGRLGVVDAIVDNTEDSGLVSAIEGDGRVRTNRADRRQHKHLGPDAVTGQDTGGLQRFLFLLRGALHAGTGTQPDAG